MATLRYLELFTLLLLYETDFAKHLNITHLMPYLFQSILGAPPNGIPSRQEQADLLKNVEEVFKQVRLMVNDEGKLTDKSAVADLENIVKREQDKLCLVEELALLSR